jgi:diadenosine tetraphosphate (Ap4A) HIT family hydrolase
MQCEQVTDPEGKVVYATEHFVGYVSPIYPWGVILTTRRHACDGPWALNEAEAVDLGRILPRIAAAVRTTGGERAYVLSFGEETPVPHFHLAILSRHLPMSEAERAVLYARVGDAPSNPEPLAADLAAALRAELGDPGTLTGHTTAPAPGCMICLQVFDPERQVVYDTEYFVGYVTPKYPWAVMLTTRRHGCQGPWALTEAEGVDLGSLIAHVAGAMRRCGDERVYLSLFGEESPVLHFHLGLLSRYEPLAQAEHDVMYKRVQDALAELSSTPPTADSNQSRPSMRDRAEGAAGLAHLADDLASAVRSHIR